MTAARLDALTILVPVDFDEPSRAAVAFAAELGHALQARVVVLHVVPPTGLPEGTRVLPSDEADPVEVSAYVSARAKDLLVKRFTEALLGSVEARIEARAGHPVPSILRAIEEWKIGLVVLGTHGRKGASRALLGSVAESLVRTSPVPVLVVPAEPASSAIHEIPGAIIGSATLTGAVAGAATGALAGPAGIIAGGVIGTVVGAAAGRAIANEDARWAAHDRELDEKIGITKGSMGARPETRRLEKQP